MIGDREAVRLCADLPEEEAGEKFPEETQADSGKPTGGYKEQYGVIVICSGEDQQAEIFEKPTADGLTCKIVVT